MHVHPMEVAMSLKFSGVEKLQMSPSFAFGDAEEQLSYALHLMGSERLTSLIVESDNDDIGMLALEEVDGFREADWERIQEMVGRHGRKLNAYVCSHCHRERRAEVCPRLCHYCLKSDGFEET